MKEIERIIQNLNKLTPAVQEKAILEIVTKHEATLVDYNIAQMMEGERSDGSEILPEYTPLTVAIKNAKGQPSDRVTLRDEGDFQQEMFAETKQFPVEIMSTNWKEAKLIRKYGDRIFGINEKHKTEFVHQDIK